MLSPEKHKFNNSNVALFAGREVFSDSVCSYWLHSDLYAFQPHAFRNRWKGRVLAGCMVIVFTLILGYTCCLFHGTVCRNVCVCVLCCIYVTSCNVMWVCLASTSWTLPDGFPTYCTRKLLRQALELFITHHVTVTLFSFSFFFLFFFLHRFQFWLLEMFEGGFERNECTRWLLLISWSPFYPRSSLRVWLQAGRACLLLGYCLFDRKQTRSIL